VLRTDLVPDNASTHTPYRLNGLYSTTNQRSGSSRTWRRSHRLKMDTNHTFNTLPPQHTSMSIDIDQFDEHTSEKLEEVSNAEYILQFLMIIATRHGRQRKSPRRQQSVRTQYIRLLADWKSVVLFGTKERTGPSQRSWIDFARRTIFTEQIDCSTTSMVTKTATSGSTRVRASE